ncbi:MAG: hypothetical protein TREMPRED_000133 [Tremellales sp. Tagirdzhanova-0007]|nr:MAG: hypothetical protein TREMPRED_000133 [Tremellales sp. Tagirdzhanova-0007]
MPPLLSDEESAIDPYILLELGPQATEKDVDRAFRRKSLKYHSDKNSTLEAVVIFRQMQLAKEILLDTAKRRYVDTRLESDRLKKARDAERSDKRKAMIADLNAREETAKKAKTQQTQSIAQEEAIFEYYRIRLEAAREQARAKQRILARQIDQLTRAGSSHTQIRNTTGQDWEYDTEFETRTLLRMRQVGKEWEESADVGQLNESDGTSTAAFSALPEGATAIPADYITQL